MGPGLDPHRDPEAGGCHFPPSILIGSPTPPRSPRSRLEVRALPEPRRMGGRAACPLAPSRCRVTHRGLGHQQIKINEAVSLWLPPSGCCSVAPSLGFVPPPHPGLCPLPKLGFKGAVFLHPAQEWGPPPHIPEVGAGHWLYCCPRHYFKKHLPTELGAGTLEGLPGHGTGSPEEGRGELSPTCPAPPCRPHLPRPLRSPPLRAAPLLPEKGTPPPVAPTNTHSQIPQLSR